MAEITVASGGDPCLIMFGREPRVVKQLLLLHPAGRCLLPHLNPDRRPYKQNRFLSGMGQWPKTRGRWPKTSNNKIEAQDRAFFLATACNSGFVVICYSSLHITA